MLGISLRGHITKEEIRRRTKVINIVERTARLKWQRAGHIDRKKKNKWIKTLTHWRSRAFRRIVCRPQLRWRDDSQRHLGNNWIQIPQESKTWKEKEEVFFQEQILIG